MNFTFLSDNSISTLQEQHLYDITIKLKRLEIKAEKDLDDSQSHVAEYANRNSELSIKAAVQYKGVFLSCTFLKGYNKSIRILFLSSFLVQERLFIAFHVSLSIFCRIHVVMSQEKIKY